MSKIKTAGIAVGIIGSLLFVVLAAWLWDRHWNSSHVGVQKSGTTTSSLLKSSASASDLKVENGGNATSLGQLTSDAQGQDTANSKPTSPQGLNPDNFKDYEKYKDNKDALFGEILPGTGTELAAGKKAAIYYKVWLTDGRLLDTTPTDTNGQSKPFLLTLGAHEVIPGLEEGLIGMKTGGMRVIIVPPALGYGASGKDPVPANAVLVFQVQLLTVQ